LTLGLCKKTVKKLSILSYNKMGKKFDRLAHVGQAEIAAHGKVKAVANSVGIDNDARGCLLD